jgi:hypothetical protein
MRIVDQLKEDVEDLGYAPGTEQYTRELRKLQVYKCQDIRGLNECRPCVAYFDCELVRLYKLDIRYPLPKATD